VNVAVTGRLAGRVALITGAARGQGREHAIALAGAGADVVCLDVPDTIESLPYAPGSAEDLAETVAAVEALDRRAIAVQGDVRRQEDLDLAVERAVRDLGGLDIVVANAGIWALAPAWEITELQWAEMVDVVLSGPWRTVKAAAPHLLAQGSGSVILTSSVNGLEAGPDYAHYTAAKHGVIGLMRSLAVEMAPYGVRCNAICPGFVDTKMNDWQGCYDMMAGHPGGTPEDREESSRHWSALAGRAMLRPKSMSGAVVFLASDDAADITGVALPVDGGHMVLPGFNSAPVREPLPFAPTTTDAR
jgi:SDR family mycofactocin-dependent oxidoreductase